jgi:exopolyphosphatase/guanosine-5'-triphosphate,3'-diphosphate pyrophosphatase
LRVACIDIGSNTTRLLVADCDGTQLRGVHQERAYTRIGRDLGGGGRISTLKVAEVGEVVAAQLERARAHDAGLVRCVATAAVRRASNGGELVRWIEKRCSGLAVEILSEQDEARLAFLGASQTLGTRPSGLLGLVDVGGGSSELVVGDPDGTVRWWTSLPLGSGDLTAAFVHGDPPSAAEIDATRTRVRRALAEVKPPRPALAVAVGGSATSLLQMGGRVLDAEAFDRALSLLRRQPAVSVARETGLDAERVRLLAAGILILREVAGRFEQPLVVGSGGLREGVLLGAAGG